MKIRSIQIRPTDQVCSLDGVDVRVWHGLTNQGQDCLVFVHRIAIDAMDQTGLAEAIGPEIPPPTTITPALEDISDLIKLGAQQLDTITHVVDPGHDTVQTLWCDRTREHQRVLPDTKLCPGCGQPLRTPDQQATDQAGNR
jgi:hypothetical protein